MALKSFARRFKSVIDCAICLAREKVRYGAAHKWQ
jgi:hypothetical protein